MTHRSKRYKKEAEVLTIDPVGLGEALEKVKSFKSVKFDQSVECVV
nr:50S ribosomal protein L1 [Planctomycetota bacterium]